MALSRLGTATVGVALLGAGAVGGAAIERYHLQNKGLPTTTADFTSALHNTAVYVNNAADFIVAHVENPLKSPHLVLTDFCKVSEQDFAEAVEDIPASMAYGAGLDGILLPNTVAVNEQVVRAAVTQQQQRCDGIAQGPAR